MEISQPLSHWCRLKYDEALEEGRMDDAENYRMLFELWNGRGF